MIDKLNISLKEIINGFIASLNGDVQKIGFGFWKDKDGWKARPHESSVERLKRKLKALCKRNWSVDLTYRIKKINEVTKGWINYFRIASMKTKIQRIDEQMRVRMIIIIWKQWKTRAKRF